MAIDTLYSWEEEEILQMSSSYFEQFETMYVIWVPISGIMAMVCVGWAY